MSEPDGRNNPKPGPQSAEDWMVHSLNIHGEFFERACQQTLRETFPWQLTTTEFPVSVNGHESALDIRADAILGNTRLVLLVECKKNNPEFINWIFFRKVNREPHPGITFPCINPQGYHFFQDVANPVRATIVDVGRETRNDYSSYKNDRRDKTKTSKTAITDAAKQISLAAQSIWAEEAERSRQRVQTEGTGCKTYIMPVIVTSARLLICDFNDSDVDRELGEIPFDKVKMTPVETFVIYEFPLPTALQESTIPMLARLDLTAMDRYVRRQILVVQSSTFKHFLQNHALQMHHDYV